jgi:undecaprenyl diphosphate synthase
MDQTLPRSTPHTADEIRSLELNPDRIPQHIAIIMDGNGRWAKERGMPRIEGHRKGVASVRAVVEEASRLGLKQLTLYCFSTENWKRPQLEQNLLMRLLHKYVIDERELIMEQGLQFDTIGRRDRLGKQVLKEIDITREQSANNTGMTLCLALDYGSRDEIVTAVQDIAAKTASGEMSPEQITEETISNHLHTAGSVDPDLVIRTAGEMRISNFLLWQISYAELWVTQKFWPDFRENDLHDAVRSFGSRKRRFGSLENE